MGVYTCTGCSCSNSVECPCRLCANRLQRPTRCSRCDLATFQSTCAYFAEKCRPANSHTQRFQPPLGFMASLAYWAAMTYPIHTGSAEGDAQGGGSGVQSLTPQQQQELYWSGNSAGNSLKYGTEAAIQYFEQSIQQSASAALKDVLSIARVLGPFLGALGTSVPSDPPSGPCSQARLQLRHIREIAQAY